MLSTYLAGYKSAAAALGMSESEYFMHQFLQYAGGQASTVIDAVASAAVTASDTATASAVSNAKKGMRPMYLLSVDVSDLASGGDIGSAASTVDVASVALLDQTTAAQTVTLPAPTAATLIRKFTLVNIGSQSVTFYGATVAASAAQDVIWTGSAWVPVA